jgi:hypothetical protein
MTNHRHNYWAAGLGLILASLALGAAPANPGPGAQNPTHHQGAQNQQGAQNPGHHQGAENAVLHIAEAIERAAASGNCHAMHGLLNALEHLLEHHHKHHHAHHHHGFEAGFLGACCCCNDDNDGPFAQGLAAHSKNQASQAPSKGKQAASQGKQTASNTPSKGKQAGAKRH